MIFLSPTYRYCTALWPCIFIMHRIDKMICASIGFLERGKPVSTWSNNHQVFRSHSIWRIRFIAPIVSKALRAWYFARTYNPTHRVSAAICCALSMHHVEITFRFISFIVCIVRRCVCRAAVFICHGAGEHCQTYAKLASMLTERNMFVFAHDHGECTAIVDCCIRTALHF